MPTFFSPAKGWDAERRSKRRYRIPLSVEYKGPRQLCGRGAVLDISSGGVRITTDRELEYGAGVELHVSWPCSGKDADPMLLILFGVVLRSSCIEAALKIKRWALTDRKAFVLRPKRPGVETLTEADRITSAALEFESE